MMATDLSAPLDAPYDLAPEHVEAFRERGFVKLKDVVPPAVLAHYGEVISVEVAERNPLRDTAMAERSTYEQAFIQITNLWRLNDAIRRFVFSPRLARLAAALMGVDGVRLYHDQALFKERGGGFTPWHADQYYWPLSTSNTCTVWIPLQPVTRAMGPLSFSVGSHRFERGRDLAISDESEAVLAEALQSLEHAVEPFDLGEVSYHYGWTFHRAGPNTSDAPRRVMTVIYIEDGIRVIAPQRDEHVADQEAFLPGLQPGDPAATPLNPLLWHAAWDA